MFKKMPNASNLLYTMLVAVFFVGCKTDNNGFGDFQNNAQVAEKMRKGEIEIEIIEIDSCEYLFTSTLPWSSEFALTHKGNCKFCLARHAK